ncbi:MAG: hypothetical protein FWC56_00925, partial [Phycisphaerae bacterium]|nr:hypothetical protein [Phycisphaerae bacterium]
MKSFRPCRRWNVGMITALLLLLPAAAWAMDFPVFIRVKILKPTGQTFNVGIGGKRHYEPWNLNNTNINGLQSGQWSAWTDISNINWHDRGSRSGGMAEWCSLGITLGGGTISDGCEVEVQLADQPNDSAIVHWFMEKGTQRTIRFLVPVPLRDAKAEFETASQMATRHLDWAREVTGNKPIRFQYLDICTQQVYYDDKGLSQLELQTLKQLGFNVLNPDDNLFAEIRNKGFRLYQQQWIYNVFP